MHMENAKVLLDLHGDLRCTILSPKTTFPYSTWSNGLSKRNNRTILDKAQETLGKLGLEQHIRGAGGSASRNLPVQPYSRFSFTLEDSA